MAPNGFFRVAAVCPRVNPADVDGNVDSIVECLAKLDDEKVELAVFPELCITGYTCGDLFLSATLQDAALRGLEWLREFSKSIKTAFVVGCPMVMDGALYNMGVMLAHGDIVLETGKRNIPNYREFYEKRWFAAWNEPHRIVDFIDSEGHSKAKVGIEICEDLWVPSPPSVELCKGGADIIVNLSASDDVIGKYRYLLNLIVQQSARLVCGYVYAGAGFGESSTDLVFDGKAIIAENGRLLKKNSRWNNDSFYTIADIDIELLRQDRKLTQNFSESSEPVGVIDTINDVFSIDNPSELRREVSPRPFVPESTADRDERCEEIIDIQTAGLARRLDFTGCRNLAVGISGGLDSTLALLVACRSFDRLGLDRNGIHAISMPGFGTTSRTENNARELCECLGVDFEIIPIGDSVRQHFKDIGHDENKKDVTYENAQARTRTLILMDKANQLGGMVLGTGDLSELALGWATYNGDHMSMYNVNAGVPKTLVRHLVGWFASEAAPDSLLRVILTDIIDTPISPELLPPNPDGSIAQRTEDVVGPYELHDFFLYYTLRYGFSPAKVFFLARKAFNGVFNDSTILHWLRNFYRRFFSQQFKRSCIPDGPKVGSVCLSPRGDWRMPSDASAAIWLKQVNELGAE